MIFFSLFCFIPTFFTTSSLEAATLHAILVGDTHDDELREVIKKDMKHMEDYLNAVFDSLNVDDYEQTSYTGRHVNTTFMNDLATWDIQPDDIVFFYFSGHGFYGENSEIGNWPTLYLSKQDIGINQFDIMQALRKHNPRLLICFADCCNNILDEDDETEILHPAIIQKVARQKEFSNALNIQKLFWETKGVIMISSASPSYYAEGTDKKGSCFTNFYIKTFQKATQSNHHPNIDWDFILSKSQRALWKRQRPQYQLFLY